MFFSLAASAIAAGIDLSAAQEPCVQWAAGELASAIEAAGISSGKADVAVKIASDSDIPAEGFEIRVNGASVEILASDAVGAMYGVFELAERIESGGARSDWPSIAASVSPVRQAPFMEFRADQPYVPPALKTRDTGPFDDLKMWKRYVDMLARNRFNVLDLHGGWNMVATTPANFYPTLVHVPEYPAASPRFWRAFTEQEQAQNLANFKALVAHAKDRGVKVALMNYDATLSSSSGVPEDRLADYTAKAVAKLLTQVPDLYMLGFRVGESGQRTDFYQNAYLKGVRDAIEKGRAPETIRLYSRSWGAQRADLQIIADACGGRFDIELKYNGEHLGLPYQAIHGRYTWAYSYEGYLTPPKPYGVIWHVWMSGTHRLWAWCDTELIRRTARTFQFGNGKGYSIQPHIGFYSAYPSDYYESEQDRKVYDYIWEKHWATYFAWGRLGYNPDLPEEVFVQAYERKFGPAGRDIYRALQESGRILPMAYAYRYQGPDHRDFSPETETGVDNGRMAHRPAGPLAFACNIGFHHWPMDVRSFAGIPEFVNNKLAGRPDGRVGPAQVADILSIAAASTREILTDIPELPAGRAADEWRLLKSDILCAADMGEYYVARILGSMHLFYALRTGNEVDRQKAEALLTESRSAWKAMAAFADSVYIPIQSTLRGLPDYEWSSQNERLEKWDASIPGLFRLEPDKMEYEWGLRAEKGVMAFFGEKLSNAQPLVVEPWEQGADTGIIVKRLEHSWEGDPPAGCEGSARIECEIEAEAGVASVLLWHKLLPSNARMSSPEVPTNSFWFPHWLSTPMSDAGNGRFEATLPVTFKGLLYQVEVCDAKGRATHFPHVLTATPYRAIEPWAPDPESALLGADLDARQAALYSLGLTGANGLPLLAAAASAAGDDATRDFARSTLARMQGFDVESAMLAFASDTAAEPAERIEIMRALSSRNAHQAVPVLLAAARDADAEVRIAALAGLEELKPADAIAELIALVRDAGRDDERQAAACALAAAAVEAGVDGKALEMIVSAFEQSSDVSARSGLLSALGHIGGDRALDITRRALDDKGLRAAAVMAMAGWPDSAPMEDLRTVAEADENPGNRATALAGYIRMIGLKPGLTTAQACGLYKTAMDLAERDEEKILVFEGLGGTPAPETLRYIEECLDELGLMGEDNLLPNIEAAYVDAAIALAAADRKAALEALQQFVGSSKNKELVERATQAMRSME